MNKTPEELLACAKRELAMRREFYPKWVLQGRMDQAKVDHEIGCMEGLVALAQAHVDKHGEQITMFAKGDDDD